MLRGSMSIETSMVSDYSNKAQEYERIYDKPERQAGLRQLRSLLRACFPALMFSRWPVS